MSDASDAQLNTKEHPDLYRKTIRGGAWLMAERITLQFFALVRLLVLARLLPPREFGVLGIAMLLLHILETFTQTGFGAALVQRKEQDVHPYLNTAWTVNVLRGAVLFLIFVAAAPLAIQFFDGDGTFRPVDFHKPAELAGQLMDQDDPLATHLMRRLPRTNQREIEAIVLNPPSISESKNRLSRAFNLLVDDDGFYRPEAFEQIALSPYALDLIASRQPHPHRRTHRLLLEQAWPNLIDRSILDRPQLTWIIRVIGIVLLCRAFGNPAIIYFTKTMRFEKSFAMHTIATIVNVTATVILAVVLRSVWALVWGLLLAEFSALLLSYLMHPWRPRPELNRTRLVQMWRFGRWITGLSMLDFLLTTGDSVLIGRFLGATSLGLYQMATRFSAMPIQEFTAVISRAIFPAFCHIQSDIVRLREAFLKTIDITSALVMPAVGGILLFSDDIVRLFMQESWLPMVQTLRVLAVLGLFRTQPIGALFQALGKPQYMTVFLSVRVLLV